MVVQTRFIASLTYRSDKSRLCRTDVTNRVSVVQM